MAYKIDNLLEFMVENKGSDMILTVDQPPSIRINGIIRTIAKDKLGKEDMIELMKAITPERGQKEIEEVGSTDFAFTFRDKGSLRASVFRQRGNICIVLRLIPNQVFNTEDLGLPDEIKKQIMRPRGLFLVTGPTGSGKTTTLASLIHFINDNAQKHIITVEDPIEFHHPHSKSIITQREVGTDVPSFSEALKRALRQDPDVILVGEMRDLETIQIALSAAETGHLVMATLHTNSAYSTVTRIIDSFPHDQQAMVRTQLSVALNVVICQTLLKNKEGGRTPAYEIMILNSGMRNLIRENRIQQLPSAIQTSGGDGNIMLDDYLFSLLNKGKITDASVMERAADPKNMIPRIKEYKKKLEEQQQQQAKKK